MPIELLMLSVHWRMWLPPRLDLRASTKGSDLRHRNGWTLHTWSTGVLRDLPIPPPRHGFQERYNFHLGGATTTPVHQPLLLLQTVYERFKINKRFILLPLILLSDWLTAQRKERKIFYLKWRSGITTPSNVTGIQTMQAPCNCNLKTLAAAGI